MMVYERLFELVALWERRRGNEAFEVLRGELDGEEFRRFLVAHVLVVCCRDVPERSEALRLVASLDSRTRIRRFRDVGMEEGLD